MKFDENYPLLRHCGGGDGWGWGCFLITKYNLLFLLVWLFWFDFLKSTILQMLPQGTPRLSVEYRPQPFGGTSQERHQGHQWEAATPTGGMFLVQLQARVHNYEEEQGGWFAVETPTVGQCSLYWTNVGEPLSMRDYNRGWERIPECQRYLRHPSQVTLTKRQQKPSWMVSLLSFTNIYYHLLSFTPVQPLPEFFVPEVPVCPFPFSSFFSVLLLPLQWPSSTARW